MDYMQKELIKTKYKDIILNYTSSLLIAALLGLYVYIYVLFFKHYSIRRYDLIVGMDGVSLIGCLIISFILAFEKHKEKNNAFWFSMVAFFIAMECFCDGISGLFDGHSSFNFVNNIVTTIGFLVTPFLVTSFRMYQTSLYSKKTKPDNIWAIAIMFVVLLDVLLIITNNQHHLLFTIDNYGTYIEGSGIMISSITPAIVIALCVIENLKAEIDLRQRVTLLLFGIMSIVAGFVDFLFYPYTFVGVVEFSILLVMYGNIQVERGYEIAKINSELIKSQTQLMVSQIKPHFIYNTLNVISGLCEEDPIKARDTVDQFSLYLRNNLESLSKDQIIPFKQELEHTNTYLEIEKTRYQERLNVEYDIQYDDFMIPSLTLQPIVENAVKHGICKKRKGGTVKISTYKQNGSIYVIVVDDGVGFDTSEKMGVEHIGIKNVSSRLVTLVGGKLFIGSEIGKGTKATIVLNAED